MEPRNEVILRPCLVSSIGKGLFHCWEFYSQPVPSGVTIGSPPAGVISRVYGIIEDRNGQVHRVSVGDICFTDCKVEEYYFDPQLEQSFREMQKGD